VALKIVLVTVHAVAGQAVARAGDQRLRGVHPVALGVVLVLLIPQRPGGAVRGRQTVQIVVRVADRRVVVVTADR
jgi:hypothetical protein